MYPPNQNVILSIAKNLYTSTCVYRFFTTFRMTREKEVDVHFNTPTSFFIPQFPQNTPDARLHTRQAWQ